MNATTLPAAAIDHTASVPKAPRIPSDLAWLDVMSPMQHSFRHFGSLDWRMKDYIGGLISEALAAR